MMDNEQVNFSWAENYPEVHKVCTLFSLTDLNNPLQYSYTPLTAFMQEGPQCGLVALAMYMGNPSQALIQTLFKLAKEQGYTNHGEMFSVENMTKLAKSQLQSHQIEAYSGLLDTDHIKDVLLNGANILVPYDSGKGNWPGLLNGHKAHWAIICGAVKTATGFYVLARHGKARNVAIWKLSDLSESNAQLNEVITYEKRPELEFRLPEGGIQGPKGLKCKSVILMRR